MDHREIRGRWWLAGRRKRDATPGTLVISPRREVRLELDDDMDTGVDWIERWNDPDARVDLFRVFGETSFRVAKPITLDGCFFTRDENRLTANVAAVGAKVPSGSDITFREIRFGLSHLDAWSRRKGFGFDRKWHADEDPLRFSLDWRKPPPCVARLPDRTLIEIVSDLNEGTWGSSRTKADLAEQAHVRVLFPKRVELARIRKAVYVIRNLLALGVGNGVSVEWISAYASRPRTDRDLYFGHVELVYPIIEPDIEADDEPNPLAMPFLLDNLAERFDEHVNRWVDAMERLGVVADMYFSLLHAPPTYPETRFLILMQALEGYHRRMFPDDVAWSKGDWPRVKKKLLAGLDPADAKKLGGKRLEILNSTPLSGRLSKLMSLCPQTSKRIVTASRTTKGSYLEVAQATRNDQAHLLVPPPTNAAKGADLLRIEAQSQALLEALLFLELGFEDAALGDMLWRARRLDRIRLWAP